MTIKSGKEKVSALRYAQLYIRNMLHSAFYWHEHQEDEAEAMSKKERQLVTENITVIVDAIKAFVAHEDPIKSDARERGFGLSNREVRDALLSIDSSDLDKPFVVQGRKDGYDYLCFAGPAEKVMRIGTKESNSVLVNKGRFVAILQDNNIVFDVARTTGVT